jgi:hypothetical protein
VDGEPDRVPRAMQAATELGLRLDKPSLRCVYLASAHADPARIDRRRLRVADELPGLARPAGSWA